MSLLAPLRKLFTPPKASSRTPEGFPIPYGLTPEEYALLRSHIKEREWEIYVKALDSALRFHAEKLIQTSSNEALHFSRGFISGLRRAAGVVSEIEAAERSFNENLKRQENVRKRSDTSLYGTPAFRRTSRDD
jgi:hypothetical protein